DGGVHAGARLEFPKLRAVARVERREPAVVAAHEHEAAGRRDRAAVALLGPVLPPSDRVGAQVYRAEHAELAERRGAEDSGRVALAAGGLRRLDRLGAERADAVLSADEEAPRRRL